MVQRVPAIVRDLASKRRVLLLDGLAVIYYDLPRSTKDVDIWLDPGESAIAWATELIEALAGFPAAYLRDLSRREKVGREDVAEIAEVTEIVGVIRVGGLELSLDNFSPAEQSRTRGIFRRLGIKHGNRRTNPTACCTRLI